MDLDEKLEEMRDVLYSLEKTEKELKDLKLRREEITKNLVSEYFGGNIPKEIALTKKQFLMHPVFSFQTTGGKVHWVATGFPMTLKNGRFIHGVSKKNIFQGEYEAFPKELKELTREKALELGKPVFNILPALQFGCDHSAQAYELAVNKDLGIVLAWRQSGAAYIDRSSGTQTANAKLQLLRIDRKAKKEMEDTVPEKYRRLVEQTNHYSYCDVPSSGRLKTELIVENKELVETLFGEEAYYNILNKLDRKKKTNVEEVPATEIKTSKIKM